MRLSRSTEAKPLTWQGGGESFSEELDTAVQKFE